MDGRWGRNTVKERGRENKRLRQMDEDLGERVREKRRRAEEGRRMRKEKEKRDTFITRRRATGKIERQVVFARGSLPEPRGRRGREEKTTPGGPGCAGETARKGRYTVQETSRYYPLVPDHFLCKIKYCKYDWSGHIGAHRRRWKAREWERKRERKRCLLFSNKKRILRSRYFAGVREERDTDVETFDIVNLIFPWSVPSPYVFSPISVAVSEDSGLPNRSATWGALKYTECVGSSHSLPPYSVHFSIFIFSLRAFFSPNSKNLLLFTANSIEFSRCVVDFLIFNLVIKRIETLLKPKSFSSVRLNVK